MRKRSLPLLLLGGASLLSCAPTSVTPGEGVTNLGLSLTRLSDYKEQRNLPSKGEQKILVVPCVFQGERSFSEGQLETVRKAFFGEDLFSEGSYYSLAEYYKETSLGALSLKGEVTDVLEIPYDVETLEGEGSYLPGVAASYLYDSADFADEYFQSFDQDKDGFLDAVVFVYSSPASERTGSFWAWVANVATEANIKRPLASRHMWVGIDFFVSDEYAIDAHSIIHEAGHLLGLRDYYPSDNYNLALGGHSMMDYNISDHDPYSKLLLGWGEAIYYDFDGYSEVTVTLPPFEGTNKFLLYKPDWNHSPLDEYLIFEYYTPTGLNSLDAKTQYKTRPLGFTKPGIKVYHADSRVAKCLVGPYALSFDSYVEEVPDAPEEGVYYLIGASNSKEDSYTDASRQGRYKQIALIENKEYNTLQSGSVADNASLFYEGDAFDSATSAYLLNGKFNDGTSVDLKVTVDRITEEGATLTLKYGGNEK